jgi:hypothetical protein
MPLTKWPKLAIAVQSTVSLFIVALVISRQ